MAETVRHGGAPQGETDALVVFGITGDLAKKMTFVSLYRLERRKELRCRVVGVAIDDLSDDELRARARDAIEHADGTLDEQVFERLAERLTYVPGDYDDPATYTRLGKHLGEVGHTTFYLEIPPSLFERVVRGLHDAGLTGYTLVSGADPAETHEDGNPRAIKNVILTRLPVKAVQSHPTLNARHVLEVELDVDG